MRVLIGSNADQVARIAADNVLAGLAEHGAGRGVPELRLQTGAEGITLTDRDQILQLQAIINRAVNQWRESASHLI